MYSNDKKQRPITTYILICLLLFQAISAIPAGAILSYDPSGETLGLPITLIQDTVFKNFFIPGMFLCLVLGVFPAITVFGLIKKNSFSLANKINLYKNYHWSWTCSYYVGLLLVLWINTQLFFIKSFDILHIIYSMLGVLIIFISQLPSTKKNYKIN